MTTEEAKIIIARRHGMNKLVTGHSSSLYTEAMELYANYKVNEILNQITTDISSIGENVEQITKYIFTLKNNNDEGLS